MDPLARYLSATVDGLLVAYIRVGRSGGKFAEPSIGWVMTLKAFRGRQYSRAFMSEAIRFTEKNYPGMGISEPYDEDGIPNIDMIKPAAHA